MKNLKTTLKIIAMIFVIVALMTMPLWAQLTPMEIAQQPVVPLSWAYFFQMLFICILGGIAHFVIKVIEHIKKDGYHFGFSTYLKQYYLPFTLNLTLSLIIIYVGMIDESLIVVTPLMALIVGYSGSSFFKNLVETKKSK